MKSVLWIGSLLILSGCSLSMPHQRELRHLCPPPNIDCSVYQALDSKYFENGAWPGPAWWEVYGFPELNQLIVEALAQNPSIHEIEARVCRASAEAVIAQSKLYPLVTLDGQDEIAHLAKHGLYRTLNPRIPPNVQLIQVELNFKYEFDFWGKNRNLVKAACGEKFAELAEVEQIKLITSSALASAFFALKTDLKRRDLYRELVEVRRGEKTIQSGLAAKSLSSNLKPFFYEEDYLEAEKLLLSVERDIELDKHWINILAGRSPDHPLCIDSTLPTIDEKLALPCNLSLDLVARRPDLMSQIWRAKAIAYEVGAAYAEFYPDVNLSALFGLESVTWRQLFRSSAATWSVTPAFHLPIFTAGAIAARVKERTCAYDEAIFAYNDLLLGSAREVVDLLSIARMLFAQKDEQQKILKMARKRLEITKARRCSGLDNKIDLYLIEEEVINKKLDDLSLLYQQYVATVKLAKALGGGYVAPCGSPLVKEECRCP
jgi:NodT family efflux transporter outer membrane factor (OMF) lipoprotein